MLMTKEKVSWKYSNVILQNGEITWGVIVNDAVNQRLMCYEKLKETIRPELSKVTAQICYP